MVAGDALPARFGLREDRTRGFVMQETHHAGVATLQERIHRSLVRKCKLICLMDGARRSRMTTL